jgi:hypothetical protein
MKNEVYSQPKSSFLSVEKDLSTIISKLMENNRLKKMLYYTTKDCLTQPRLTEDQTFSLLGDNIRIIPKIKNDSSIKNYVLVSFTNFTPNYSNPEFRDNIVEFNILCHFDQWELQDFQLRPFKIAAEIDTMFNNSKLSGIGTLEFLGADRLVLDDEYGGICLLYKAIHGEDDRKNALNPLDEEALIQNFNELFNGK